MGDQPLEIKSGSTRVTIYPTWDRVNGARKVHRVGAPKGALEKCGNMPRKEHVCRYGAME